MYAFNFKILNCYVIFSFLSIGCTPLPRNTHFTVGYVTQGNGKPLNLQDGKKFAS